MVQTIKRATTSIFDKGGNIRKIENLGSRELPYKISLNREVQKEGNYILLTADLPTRSLKYFQEECKRDLDVIRNKTFIIVEPRVRPCTLEQELVVPSYRKHVQKLMKMDKKKRATKWQANSGLDYYPFQR